MSPTRTSIIQRSGVCAAAAVCLLGPMASAHSTVVVRTVGVTLNSATLDSYDLDVELNGTTDFSFDSAFSSDPFFGVLGFAQITLPFASSNAFVVDSGAGSSFALVSRLLAGASVSGASMFSALGDPGDLASEFFAPSTGNFFGQTGFVGLRFVGDNGSLFGFAEITVDGPNASNPYSLTIGRVGYETDGSAVQIPGANVVPEPGSLALLAAAGIGFLATRRRRPSAGA